MESFSSFYLPAWSVVTGATAVVLYILYVYATRSYDAFKKLGLNGPKPKPFIGNMIDNFTKSIPDNDTSRSLTYGKVYGIFEGTSPMLMVGDVGVAQEILIKEFTSFTNRPQFRSLQQKPMDRILSVICDDHWRHVRSSILPTFSSGKLKMMMGTIRDCADTTISYIDKKNSIPLDPKEIFSGFTMDVIAGVAFGLDLKSLEHPENPFLEHAKHLFSFAGTKKPLRLLCVIIALTWERLSWALYKMGFRVYDATTVTYMENIVKQALYGCEGKMDRPNFAQLCMSQLVEADKVDRSTVRTTSDGIKWTTKGLMLDDIVSNSIIFLVAGYETTATFLSFFCYVMATNPEVQERLYKDVQDFYAGGDFSYERLKDMEYLDMCVDEVFRMYPPASRLFRTCNRSVTVGGVTVPEGMNIAIPVYAIHHDADYWNDPYTFKPERFLPSEKAKLHPCAYMPFGAGPRNCIGMRLALLEAKTAVLKLLQKYQVCACEDTPKAPLKFAVGFGMLTPAKPIVVKFKPRNGTGDDAE